MYLVSYTKHCYLKIQTTNTNCVRCSGAVKAHSETNLISVLLETIVSTFRKIVYVLDSL
jgi:hypothetical protein